MVELQIKENIMKSKSIISCLIGLIAISGYLFSAWEVPDATTGTKGEIRKIISFQGNIIACSQTNGVEISADQGIHWIDRNSGLYPLIVNSIETDGTNLYAGTNDSGVFRSADLGGSWSRKINGMGKIPVFGLVSCAGYMYSITDNSGFNGVYNSSDKGETWQNLNGSGGIPFNCYSLAVVKGTTNNMVYVGSEGGHLYKTVDNGTNWLDIKNNPLVYNIKVITIIGTKIYVGTPYGIFQTSDEGGSWQNIGLKAFEITDIKFNGNLLYAGTKGGGVFISDDDGSTWFAANDGLPDANVTCLGFDNNYIYAGSINSPVSRRLLSEIKVPVILPPVLTSPVNNGQNIKENPTTFTWEPTEGAVSYHIQICLINDFKSNILIEKDSITKEIYTKDLSLSTTYYWRVGTNTSKGDVKWSEVWNFRTRDELKQPTLMYPAANSQHIGTPTTFRWHLASGAQTYNFQISEDSSFGDYNQQKDIKDTIFQFPNLLKNKTTYYWHIASVGNDGSFKWSDTWVFESDSIFGEVKYLNSNDNDFLEIYPNPAIDKISLNFKFDAGNCEISLVNSSGTTVKIVYTGQIEKNQLLKLDSQLFDLARGVYFIKIKNAFTGEILVYPFVLK